MNLGDTDSFLNEDQGFEEVIREITRAFEMDLRVKDFYRLQTDPDFDPADPAAVHETSSDDARLVETLDPLEYPDEVKDVLELAADGELRRIYLGELREIERFFCVADDRIYMWPITNGRNRDVEVQIIEAPENRDKKVITAVTVAFPHSKVYEKENVKHVLVFACNTRITTIPFVTGEDGHVSADVTAQLTFRWKYEVTALVASSKEGDPTIFIGDECGDVCVFRYEMNQYHGRTVEGKIEGPSGMFQGLRRLVPSFLMTKNPITEIAFDETTGYVASLDAKSNVTFFLYKDEKLEEVCNHDKEMFGMPNMVSISPIPLSDSQWTRFVCFDARGGRWFFGTNPGVSEKPEEIVLLGTNNMLSMPDDVESCSCVLNQSIWVYDKYIVCMRPNYHPHEARRNPEEEWQCIDVTKETFGKDHVSVGKPVNLMRAMHKYRDGDKCPLFRNEFLWQHLFPSEINYLMCTKRILPLRFLRPVDQLRKLLEKCNGHFSEESDVKEWMDTFSEESESGACALLLACEKAGGKEAQYRKWGLTTLNEYGKLEMKARDGFDTRLSSIVAAFFVRAARLLSLIWYVPVFSKKTKRHKEVWVVSDIFVDMPDRVLSDLKALQERTTEAKLMVTKSASMMKETLEDQKKRSEEMSLLEYLKEFIEKEHEILTFIRILADKRRLITQAIAALDPETQRILCLEEFGSQQHNSCLFDALRKFAAAILKIDRHLSRELETKCPTFFSHKDLQIIDVTNQLSDVGTCEISVLKLDRRLSGELERKCRTFFAHEGVHIMDVSDEPGDLGIYGKEVLKLDRHMSSELEPKCRTFFAREGIQIVEVLNRVSDVETAVLENAKDTYLRLIDRPFPLDTIVDLFKRHNYFRGVIEICLKKASVIDRHQNALKWYRSDRDENDKERRAIFDKRYQCYKYCFERRMIESTPDFDMMMSSSDELFHVCLYEYLRRIGELERLVRCSSPFILTFLEEKEPKLVWKYHKYHGEFGKAANNLMQMAEGDSTEGLDKRIVWLTEARGIAKLAGSNELEKEALSKKRLAEIQKEMGERLSTQLDKLLSGQEVFDKCCKSGFWDLVIRVIGCYPLAGDRKAKVIANVWNKLMEEQFWVCSLPDAQLEITRIADCVGDPTNEVFLPALVMPVLEEYRMQKNGNELWAVKTMVAAKFDKDLMLSAYWNGWRNPDISDSIKCDFSYAIAVLVHQDAHLQANARNEIKEWFLTNGRRCRYYDEALRLVVKL